MTETERILEDLRSKDPDAIREGAYAAGEARCQEAIAFLVGHLLSDNLGVQEAADLALRNIAGSDVVRAVIPLLRSDEAPARNLAMDILREVGVEDMASLIVLLKDDDPDMRIFASDILGSTKDVIAVPALCEVLLKDPEVNVRYQAAVSLGALEYPEAAKCLHKALNDEEWVQFSVIEALTKIRDESSISALVKALDKSTDLVASMIVEALGEMGNIKAAPILLKRLGSSPTALRNKIVKAVVRILGSKALTLLSENERRNFREYLLVALEDEDEDIQDAAVKGLGALKNAAGDEATEAILTLAGELDPVRHQERLTPMAQAVAAIGLNEALTRCLRQGEWKQGMVAVAAINLLRDPKAPALLMEAFWNKDLEMQREIVLSLSGLPGPEAKDFFLDVLERHNDGTVLKSAMHYLGATLRCECAGSRLFSLLEHPFDDVKEAALDACVAIGGPIMTSRFKNLFHSPEAVQRFMATYALGKLGPGDNMDELRSALEDEEPDIRKTALEALAGMDDFPDVGLPLVTPRLNDENRDVRLAVVESLGRYPGEAVTPYLLQALGDEDDWVRIRAIEALGARREAGTVARIIPLLSGPNTLVAMKVVEALGEIGGQIAFRALLDVLNGEDPELQGAAEEAVAKIQQEQGDDN